jgi:hypothetical protein
MLSRAQASRRCDLLAPASFTDFAGWSMPVRYSSEIAEHTAVRPRKALVSELPSRVSVLAAMFPLLRGVVR